MSIIKRDFLRKTLIALGAAAAIGGATASTSFADAVVESDLFDPTLVGSPASAENPAVAMNSGGPRAATKLGNPDAAKSPSGAKNPDTAETPWDSIYVDN